MFTWRVDTTIKSNIMDHTDNVVCWESASLSSLKGNASGKLLLFYGLKAFLGIGKSQGQDGWISRKFWIKFNTKTC